MLRLGQRERADLLQPGHRSQPALLLLLRPALRDRLHRQPGLHRQESAQAAITPVDLHVDQPGRQRIHRRAAIAFDPVADDAERGHLLDQRPGELRPLPVTVDHREDLGIDKLTRSDQIALLLRGERLTQPEVVGSQRLTDAVVQIHNRASLGHRADHRTRTGPAWPGPLRLQSWPLRRSAQFEASDSPVVRAARPMTTQPGFRDIGRNSLLHEPPAVQAPLHLAADASAPGRDERPDLTGRWMGPFPAWLGDDAWASGTSWR